MTYYETMGVDNLSEIIPQKKCYLVDGMPYSRVTSVLQIINKPMLYFWYGKHGTKKCREIGLEARTRGTLVHKLIEKIMKGEELKGQYTPEATQRLLIFNRWKELHTFKNYTLEESLYSHRLKVAGTCDFVGFIDNELAVADWKTSKDIYFEYPIQIAAYMHMVYEMTGRKPACGYVIAFKEDGLYKEQPITWDQSKLLMSAFEGALAIYNVQQNPPEAICEEG